MEKLGVVYVAGVGVSFWVFTVSSILEVGIMSYLWNGVTEIWWDTLSAIIWPYLLYSYLM